MKTTHDPSSEAFIEALRRATPKEQARLLAQEMAANLERRKRELLEEEAESKTPHPATPPR